MELWERLLHACYVGLVAVESHYTYRWAAAGLCVMSVTHLWAHRRKVRCKAQELALRVRHHRVMP